MEAPGTPLVFQAEILQRIFDTVGMRSRPPDWRREWMVLDLKDR